MRIELAAPPGRMVRWIPPADLWAMAAAMPDRRLAEGGLVLQVEAGEPIPIQEHDLALAIADEAEDTQTVQPR